MVIINKTEKTIAGSVNGKPFSIPFNEVVYKKLKEQEKEYSETTSVEEVKLIEEKIKPLIELNFNELVAHQNPYLAYNPVKKQYFLVVNKGKTDTLIDDRPIPNKLADMINESFENDFDYMPLIKSWARFLNREKEYTVEDAELFANYLSATYFDYKLAKDLIEKEGLTQEAAEERALFQDIAVTQEGLWATYKVVEEIKTEWKLAKDDKNNLILDESGKPKKVRGLMDIHTPEYTIDPITGEVTEELPSKLFGEDRLFTPAIWKGGENFFSGTAWGYIYKIGEPQYIAKTNPKTNKPANINYNNTFGGGGLYSGGQRYIDTYKNGDVTVLVCFLDPANIISFQDDGSAVRSWELFPHNILEEDAELRGVYHSSKYAEESKKKTSKRIEDILLKRQEELDKAKKVTTTLNDFNG